MDRTRRIRKFVVVGAALAVVGAAAPAAYSQSADDQVVTATVNGLVSLTAGADVNLGVLDPLNTPGSNTNTGDFAVSSNIPYTVSVESSSAFMETATATPLNAPLGMTASAAVPAVGSASDTSAASGLGGALIGTNAAPLGAGTGDGTDEYTVTYLQPSSFADEPGAYSVTLTYTAASAL